MKNLYILILVLACSATAGAQHISDYHPLNGYGRPKYYSIPDTLVMACANGHGCAEVPLVNAWDIENVTKIDSNGSRMLFRGVRQGYNLRYTTPRKPNYLSWLGDSIISNSDSVVYANFTVFPKARLGECMVRILPISIIEQEARLIVTSTGTQLIEGRIDSVKICRADMGSTQYPDSNKRVCILSKRYGWISAPYTVGRGNIEKVFRYRAQSAFFPSAYRPLDPAAFNRFAVGDTMHYKLITAFDAIAGQSSFYRSEVGWRWIENINNLGRDSMMITIADSSVYFKRDFAGNMIAYDTLLRSYHTYKPSRTLAFGAVPLDSSRQNNNPSDNSGKGNIVLTPLGPARFWDQNTYFEGGSYTIRYQHWPIDIEIKSLFIGGGYLGLDVTMPQFISSGGFTYGTRLSLTSNRRVAGKARLTLVPNPASDKLQILYLKRPELIIITDTKGAIRLRTMYTPGVSLDISGLTPSLYFVQSSAGQSKLIVQ